MDLCQPRHPRQNFDPRLLFDPLQNFMDPRYPPHPRTHELMHPRYSIHAHYLADLIGKECIKLHLNVLQENVL